MYRGDLKVPIVITGTHAAHDLAINLIVMLLIINKSLYGRSSRAATASDLIQGRTGQDDG